MEQRPTKFNQQLLDLQEAGNIVYRTESSLSEGLSESSSTLLTQLDISDEDTSVLSSREYPAFVLASKTDESYLLLDDQRDGVWKFSKLLDVDALQLSAPEKSK